MKCVANKNPLGSISASKGKDFLCESRGDQTRTGDPYVPNVVRYQLRYTPKIACFSIACAKLQLFFQKKKKYKEK